MRELAFLCALSFGIAAAAQLVAVPPNPAPHAAPRAGQSGDSIPNIPPNVDPIQPDSRTFPQGETPLPRAQETQPWPSDVHPNEQPNEIPPQNVTPPPPGKTTGM